MSLPREVDVAQAYAVRLMHHLVVPTFVINAKRRVVVWNRACERLTGVPASEVIGTNKHWRAFYEKQRHCLADLVALHRPDKLTNLYREYTVSDDRLAFNAENWCVMPRLGSQLYLAIDAGPIHDEAGNLIAVVETLRDMTNQKRAEAALKSLAASDGLTGLANRRSFDQTLAQEWARAQRSKRPLSLLFADVDHFKLFNDCHGHQAGDECLRAVASVLGDNALRPADVPARYGGEEFAIIMPETDLKGASKVAERLKDVLSRHRIPHGAVGAGPFVTMSIGIASQVPSEDFPCDLLLTQVDQALYAAKHSGRDRIVIADQALSSLAVRGWQTINWRPAARKVMTYKRAFLLTAPQGSRSLP